MTSQSRRERAFSDRAQAIAAGAPSRPGMGDRTASAPHGDLYRVDNGRRPSVGTMGGQRLVEEDESLSGMSASTGALRQSRSRHGDELFVTLQEPFKTGFPEVTIAVVGEDDAGKTSFIKCALDMKSPPSSTSTRKKMSLDGAVYIVRLLEIDLKQVAIDQDKRISWPCVGRDDSVPTVDGVLLLYDSTQPNKLSEVTAMLDALDVSPLPFLLVACKCDLRPEDSELSVFHEQYEIYRTSPEAPRSQQMCIALVLRSVISNREFSSSTLPPPPRTTTKSFQPIPAHDRHHVRANSESPSLTGAAGGSTTSGQDRSVYGNVGHRLSTDQSPSNLAQQHASSSSRNARSNSQPVRPQTPPSGARLNARRPSVQGESNSPIQEQSRQQRLHNTWRNSGGSDAFNSFLNMDEEIEEGPPMSPGAVVRPKPSSESSYSAETGMSFDELVDRLVALPMSKQDSKFSAIFLCLYRKFSAPSTLLNALISRFDKNESGNFDQLARMADQLRLLNVIASWASDYPGDFAYPKTRKRINDFVNTLEKSHFYMFAAKEIGSYLDSNAEDDDVGWAFQDGDVDDASLTETFFDNSGRSSPAPFLTGTYDDHDEEEEDPIYSKSALDLSDGPHDSTSRLSGTLSISSNADRPSSITNQSFTILSLEAAQREAQRLDLSGRTSLSKIQWRFFMETPEEDFARELTRIDWITYNSFRPRDLVRHVSISGVDKDKIRSLQNVNRMIKQFNHLAFFVASMILLRDKPKHRARCMEKFMGIAVKLRRQNNYNGLGAVIAAINGTPVHRLTQTRELIPVQTQKEFMRLVILMSTQRSHFAYRLAWENSFSERIPFLPLHRRDLVSAEEGNKTFVGENKSRINWKKFEVMGEVVLGIQRSQKTPHPQAQKFEDVERLILDSKLSGDEEDLYARSLQVEPSTGGEAGRKKFGWLRA
ncbi:hypothetical protein N7476_005381 [Penicillium atrosanguineum]|uniref:Ras guanyl-nucleotide exchange factor RasGEF n=1 Tax=Penicillium atrosanguineum TaxID=1132637 RepID=A0A9W9PVG2_9EURO|nr:hypothetical protein N7476_005381 [Penicillium atrosanguineum]